MVLGLPHELFDRQRRRISAILNTRFSLSAHACGAYILHALQTGTSVADVAASLPAKFLVSTTPQRVKAYRHYAEQKGSYWTSDQLERLHWEFLYSQASLDKKLGRIHTAINVKLRPAAINALTLVRVSLCRHLELAERSSTYAC